jgi:hypothetical protein
VVVAPFRTQLPFVRGPAPAFGLHAVLSGQLLGEHRVLRWVIAEQRQAAPVAHGYCQASVDE